MLYYTVYFTSLIIYGVLIATYIVMTMILWKRFLKRYDRHAS